MSFTNQFEQYNIPLLTDGVKLPKFHISKKELTRLGFEGQVSDFEFLFALCAEGLEKKIGTKHPKYKEYQERLELELKSFKDLEFCGYALITWDIIRFCREKEIATGYARGSAAGSLVLFLIDVVSHVDPIENNLYFERFLSKTRAKFKEIGGVKHYDGSLLLDVDLDVDVKRRNEVISYLEETYKNKTSKLLTVSTLSSKILIKEIVKIYLGQSEDDANIISEMIPKMFGTVYNIDKSIENSPEFKKFTEEYPEAIKIARKLHGLYLHYGVHASAVVLSSEDISSIIPLQCTKDKEFVTGYSMEDTASLACKVDILGLRSATLIDRVCRMINIKPSDINVNDKIIYENLQHLRTPHGLFQIEADTNYKVLQKIKPRNLDDLAAIVAIARPGALQFVDAYADYVDTGNFQSIHPIFDEVFKDTGGLCLYQEQMMKAANRIGFTLDESEILRRIVGKKKIEEVKEWQVKIQDKVKENNLDPKIGEILWKILDDSASYSFNRSHSVAYATMCAATAYLKFKYPKEFFVVLLNLSQDEPNPIEEVSKIYKELQYFNIQLLPPHILRSGNDFAIEGDNIRMGLGSVKSISEKSLDKLKKFQNKHSNKFEIFHSADLAGLNLSVVTALILVGSLDDMITESRAETHLEYLLWNLLTDREKVWVLKLGKEYDFRLRKLVADLNEKIKDEKGKPVIKDSRRLTIRKYFNPCGEMFKFNQKNETFSNWYFERELIGFSYSSNLYDIYKKHEDGLTLISAIQGELQDTKVHFVCEAVEVNMGQSKEKKTPYLKVKVRDHTGELKVMMFNTERHPKVDLCRGANKGKLPKEKDILVITGKKMEGNTVFADTIGVQESEIFLRMSQMPKPQKGVD